MEKKVMIIGAGISGLSTGCYARMNGYDVEIHEAHTLPGGLCTAWKRNGYVVDGCIHWLTGTRPGGNLYRIWEELGAIQGGGCSTTTSLPASWSSTAGRCTSTPTSTGSKRT